MKVVQGPVIVIELTRRNLTALLAKLDGHPPDSACTLVAPTSDGPYAVKAVEDAEHYGARKPGPLHASTAEALAAAEGT